MFVRLRRPRTPRRFPFGLRSIRATLIYVTAAAWDRQRPVTRQALVEIADPVRPIDWVPPDLMPPERRRPTAGGMGGQILFHEIHHRARVMAMLRQVGVAAQNLDSSVLMTERLPFA